MASSPNRTILVADDDEIVRRLLLRHLKKAGYEVAAVPDGDAAIEAAGGDLAVALLDLEMPGTDGHGVLAHLEEHSPVTSVIMLSAKGQIEDAVAAMKAGAVDYLTKPIDMDAVLAAVARGAKLHGLARENDELKHAVGDVGPMADFVAEAEDSKQLLSQISKIAPMGSTVLITGPSGCGKTLLARKIHALSVRSGGPFVTVSCPALPRDLLEAELFGHEKGAFTGAAARRPGRIELANRGTLFLDEIGELPLDLQPKLLNVLQDRQLFRVGGTEPVDIDVRVIAATNRDLAAEVAAGNFREDLYYRLNVVPLDLPPLAARTADILPLARSILARFARDRRTAALDLTRAAQTKLLAAPWPGNVRQLENVLDRASIFARGAHIDASDLVLEAPQTTPPVTPGLGGSPPRSLAGKTLAEIERMAIEETLEACGGNQTAAARQLAISERTVYNKLKRYRGA